MTKFAPIFSVLTFLLSVTGAGVSQAADNDVPKYAAEPCCQLCPEAQKTSAEVALQEGSAGWLFAATERANNAEPLTTPERAFLLKLLVQELAQKGTTVMLVMPPSRALMYADHQPSKEAPATTKEYLQTLNFFRQAGFLVPAYERLQPTVLGSAEPFFFKRDIHWTSSGAMQTAQLAAADIRKLALFEHQPEQRFETTAQGVLKISGLLNNQSQALCGGQRYPLEFTPHFVTKAVDEATTTSADDIWLIGSSQSVENRFNFSGFLQQDLSRKVSNYTPDDGNSSVGWTKLLTSEAFQTKPPKLILWELPYEYRKLSASQLRQMIALVNNGCESYPTLEQKAQVFQGNKLNDVIFGANLLKTHPSQLIFDLKLSDPSIEQLLLTVWYSDGGKSDFQIRKNSQLTDSGRFSFVLGNVEMRQPRFFVSLDLALPGAARGKTTINASVCHFPDNLLQTAGR
nr:alginate biosynthesis protein AlgX [uncultured Tolumonas sp.]